MNYYVTIASGKYSLRAQALYESLVDYVENTFLVVYCVDLDSYSILNSFNNLRMILRPPEYYDYGLLRDLKATRSVSEFCWTLKPFSILETLNDTEDAEWVTYLDSDMMVFDDLNKVTSRCAEYDVIITPHNEDHKIFTNDVILGGKYNAGYVSFRNTEKAFIILNKWKDDCVQYMTPVPNNGCYADQKYLEYFDSYTYVYSSEVPGLNKGPWNITRNKFETINGRVFVDGDKLLLYHMQGFRIISPYIFDLYSGHFKIKRDLYSNVYSPYLALLREIKIQYLLTGNQCKLIYDASMFDIYFLIREFIKVVRRISNLKFIHN